MEKNPSHVSPETEEILILTAQARGEDAATMIGKAMTSLGVYHAPKAYTAKVIIALLDMISAFQKFEDGFPNQKRSFNELDYERILTDLMNTILDQFPDLVTADIHRMIEQRDEDIDMGTIIEHSDGIIDSIERGLKEWDTEEEDDDLTGAT